LKLGQRPGDVVILLPGLDGQPAIATPNPEQRPKVDHFKPTLDFEKEKIQGSGLEIPDRPAVEDRPDPTRAVRRLQVKVEDVG